jgi:2-hydroxy-6-oxonona-2,4-dienedioate hydrolase
MKEAGRCVARRRIAVAGLRVHYRVSTRPVPAERPPVVLVHGYGMSSSYMVPLAEALACDFQVYAPDLPGFGGSEGPKRVLDVPELADALAAWMASLDIGLAVLIGNSLGCQILVELALRHGERVRCLLLQAPTPDPAARSARQQILRQALNLRHDTTARMGLIAVGDFLSAGPRRLLLTLRHLLRHPIEERLSQVRMPALVLRGTHDPVVPRAWARRAAHLLPQGRLIEVAGAAHIMNFHAPERFARIVRRYVGLGPVSPALGA